MHISRIYIGGGVKLIRVGDIRIAGPVHRGMVAIGRDLYKATRPTQFTNWGTVEFRGRCSLGAGLHLANAGRITLGKDVEITENCQLNIQESLAIGDRTSVGHGCSVTDTDDHYSVRTSDGTVRHNAKGISIGRGCWLGSSTYVKKGASLPDYTTVASSCSLVAKDYTRELPPCSIIGGIPARPIKLGYRRVLNPQSEQRLRTFFENDKEAVFTAGTGADIEAFC